MHNFTPTIRKGIERIVKRYPVRSGQCSRCAREIYDLCTAEGFSTQIGRMETDLRFLITRNGVLLSRTIANDFAYHEFVRIGNRVYDAMTGPMGMEWEEYQKLFYEGVFDDGTIRVLYSTA